MASSEIDHDDDSIMQVVLFSYEFTYSPFSGNGLLTRSLVKSLLRLEMCRVMVVCCRPHDDHATDSSNKHLAPPEITTEQASRLSVHAATLKPESGWRRLDRDSAWQEFIISNYSPSQQMDIFRALHLRDHSPKGSRRVVCAIDWTGFHAWDSVLSMQNNLTQTVPLVYLNFRVYSSGVSNPAEHEWYNHMEGRALRYATRILALSDVDRISLQSILSASNDVHNENNGILTNNLNSIPPSIELLLPPLRADIDELARSDTNFDPYLPIEAANIIQRHGSLKERCFVTCVVRLSPEKDALRFAHFVEAASHTLAKHGYIPLLAGAAADKEYATLVKNKLLSSECASKGGVVIVESFLSEVELAAIFKRTAINFHPCAYDAFGMTIVEAAAFGVPSAVASGGRVGASKLLDANASFPIPMPPIPHNAGHDLSNSLLPESVAKLEEVLRDYMQLETVGVCAQQKAFAWGEAAYGSTLYKHLSWSIDQKSMLLPN
eukprot:CAMPEP_0198299464 /NCGR_PEP_ID=MMETSP1449-20131203/44839_1 /TAXON_ID=420275 /ORGANISM="Attheya septentrionalis, Strain CCMP2084" /LENGTH=491 /DNA_ID=CAMNT_0044001029 /DNA_START=43 /DNA_END=1518 /DNA_ORIENTATION=-